LRLCRDVPDVNTRSKRTWTVAILLFVATEAVAFQLRGPLLPSIQRTFATSTELLGLVATAGTAGFVLSVLAVGFVAGRLDIRLALLGSAALVGVSVLAVGLAPSFAVLLGALFVRGVATGPFRALDRAVLGHLYPDSRARAFNRYAVVWALGAAAGPLVASVAVDFGDWRYAYLGLAVAFLPAVFLLGSLDLPASVAAERPLSVAKLRTVVRRPAVAGMTGGLVLSGGVEGSLFTWLPYFAATRAGVADGSLVLFAYLLAYAPARLVYSHLVERIEPSTLVLCVASAAAPLVVVLTLVEGRLAVFATAFLLGACVSGIFPTLSAVGVDAAPAFSGPVNAIATAAGFTGIATAPVVVGVVAARAGIARGLWLLPLFLVGFVVVVGTTRRHMDTRRI
jgi:MFS family permease